MELRSSYGSTWVRSDNLDLIKQALTSILEQEGCRRISKPSLPQNPVPVMKKLQTRPHPMTPYLWVFGLIVHRFGWTSVKTWPGDLLCQRARGATRSRLSELAMQTGCDAFHYMVYNGAWKAVLEADASGRTFTSGEVDDLEGDDINNMRLYDEPINERTHGLNFFLLNVLLELQAVGRLRINYEERERRKKELEVLLSQAWQQVHETDSELEELKKSVFSEERETRLGELDLLSELRWKDAMNAQSEWEELEKSPSEIEDEALSHMLLAPMRDRYYWCLDNLLYAAYANPQQLEADEMRLLYFQPAESSGQDVAEIWEEMSRTAPPESEENIDEIPFVRAVDPKTVQLGLQDAWEYEANRPQVGWEWHKF